MEKPTPERAEHIRQIWRERRVELLQQLGIGTPQVQVQWAPLAVSPSAVANLGAPLELDSFTFTLRRTPLKGYWYVVCEGLEVEGPHPAK